MSRIGVLETNWDHERGEGVGLRVGHVGDALRLALSEEELGSGGHAAWSPNRKNRVVPSRSAMSICDWREGTQRFVSH